MYKKISTKIAILLAFIVIIFNFSSCSDTVTPQADNLEFSYASSSDIIDNNGILVLDTVKILLKDIKLNVANSSDSTNFKTGPYVLYLNFNSGVNTIGSAFIPVGTYDKIQFEVHKLNNNETVPDLEFRDSVNSYSVIAKGTYDGVRFVFKSDKSAKQKLNFTNSLVVTETKSNITLRVLPYLWFIDNNNLYMDPNVSGNHSTIENNIKDNIKANFKAFKDNDKDGNPDLN